jgi:hypothetical protein
MLQLITRKPLNIMNKATTRKQPTMHIRLKLTICMQNITPVKLLKHMLKNTAISRSHK